MKKKIYMVPEMETIDLKMNCAMLAGSLPKGSSDITDENDVLSRELDAFFE